MGGSIALGAGSVAPEAEALVVLQGDQPLVGRDMVRRLVAALADGAPAFVASRYGSVVTTPVLFSRVLFGELRALGGDRGARSILERHAERGRLVDFPEWRGADVDTPADYERVRELFAARGEALP
jgi:CTP:molybdopterin cytidylyltransferase MocA